MLAVVGIVILGGFWLLLIGPKRAAVSAAQEQRDLAAKTLADAQAAAKNGQQEKKQFRVSYAQLVKLGKAIPSETDEVSMIVQMDRMARANGIVMTRLSVGDGAAATNLPGQAQGAAPQKTTCDEGASGAAGASGATGSTATTGVGQQIDKARDGAAAANGDAERAGSSTDAETCATAPTATDLAAAGSGLELDSFELIFVGNFFDLHEYFRDIDQLVKNRNGRISSTGRLLQISKIDLKVKKFPYLEASVKMTGYRLPAEVSATAGATPSGPAPAAAEPAASAPPAAVTGVR